MWRQLLLAGAWAGAARASDMHRQPEADVTAPYCEAIAPPEGFITELARQQRPGEHAAGQCVAEAIKKGARPARAGRPLNRVEHHVAAPAQVEPCTHGRLARSTQQPYAGRGP